MDKDISVMPSKLETNEVSYKTPLNKLIQFFKTSRDKWKAKSAEKQKRIDFLETKIRDLTRSRDKWKNKAKSLEKSSVLATNGSKKSRIGTFDSSKDGLIKIIVSGSSG